ncbi:MAG: cytochrome-c peroxidase [Chthoniobacterales bacterium]
MKKLLLLLAVLAGSFCEDANAQNGVLDLTDLDNYANQPIPAYITRNNTPPGNALTDPGATLGRVLFYDKRLSRNDTISCASCHQQAHAFADAAVASTGVSGTTGRHSMRLINTRFSQEARFFWDERATSLENQTTQPVKDHAEMGFSGASGDPAFSDLVTKLSALADYRVLFAMTFGDAAINEDRIQRAISQFVRSIQSFDSKYDAGRTNTPDNLSFTNFTAAENAGKALFLAAPPAGAGCAGCHRPPEFEIDPNSRNNGLTNSIAGGTDLLNTRSPTLRDLVRTNGQVNGGFMHTGAFATLGAVIDHYNLIPGDNTNLDPRLRRPGGQVQSLNLTPTQRTNLVAFLATLAGTAVYTDARWSNPFNAAGSIDLIILPASAVTFTENTNGTATLTCQAAPNLTYTLQGSTNLSSWTNVASIVSSAQGRITRNVPNSGNAFYRFTFAPPSP